MNDHPSNSEINYVREALMQFNNEQVGNDNHAAINIVEYDEEGNVIAGIIGGTYWGWMHIDILWVQKDFRKKGIGSKLLAEAEKEAIRRGCHHVHLDTMSWQAPEFYLNHGYQVIGILPDIPDGNRKYLLQKSF